MKEFPLEIEKTEEGGSITVFMSFIFLLLFALTGAALDSARFFSAGGYMGVAAYGAEIAVYGDYNRELFHDYGLFGYGGFGGIGESDWRDDYVQILLKNLAERPAGEGQWTLFPKKYASVYQMGAVSVSLDEVGYLSQEEQFMKQLDEWLKITAQRDITQTLMEWIQGTDNGSRQSLLSGLEKTAEVEEKERLQESVKKDAGEIPNGPPAQGAGNEDIGGDAWREEKVNSGETAEAVASKTENPLNFLKKLMRDGVLALVCNEDSLAENEVYPRDNEDDRNAADVQEDETEDGKAWDQRKSGTGILKGLLRQSDSLWDREMFRNQKKKGKLLLYVSKMFGSYVDKKDRAVSYGLEYVVTGKQNQKDAMAAVVNRLFLIRTLLNYLYVGSSPLLQEKSLVTATSIAAPLAAEAFIPVIQQCILLILSLEEACVDITALLEGKAVPVLKNQTNFKIQYEEICIASKALFRQRAAAYPDAGETVALDNLTESMGYTHYLWLLLLMTSWDRLYQRSLDVIQSDLRERYNQSFELDHCISQTEVTVRYGMPLLSSVFLIKRPENAVDRDKISHGLIMRQTTVSYGYQ